jgi:NADP-dependent 3-hydroxy acid dehydrogenase YdfG
VVEAAGAHRPSSDGIGRCGPDRRKGAAVTSSKDAVTVITGATSGIGEAIARTIVQRGGRVALAARRVNRLEPLVSRLGAENAIGVPTDVSVDADVEALIAATLERFGRIDAVVANAGVGGGGSLLDGDPSRWLELLLVNVYGLSLTIHHCLKPMRAAGAGHVVIMSSTGAHHVPKGGSQLYIASKHAVAALAEGLRLELQDAGAIRVTAIAPGPVRTEFFEAYPRESRPEAMLEPEDVARTVVYALEQPSTISLDAITLQPHALRRRSG